MLPTVVPAGASKSTISRRISCRALRVVTPRDSLRSTSAPTLSGKALEKVRGECSRLSVAEKKLRPGGKSETGTMPRCGQLSARTLATGPGSGLFSVLTEEK
jgi:hypothetical protein